MRPASVPAGAPNCKLSKGYIICRCTGLTWLALLVAAAGPPVRSAPAAAPVATQTPMPFLAACWHGPRLCCRAVARGLQLHGAARSLHSMVQKPMRAAIQARGVDTTAQQCCCTAKGSHAALH